MNSDQETGYPYAPYANVLTVIRQARERGLKEPVTSSFITTIGVAEGNTTRTIRTLKFLKLLDEEGYMTPTFKQLRNASPDAYPGVLQEVLRDAYKDMFIALDPAKATDQQYINAFHNCEPRAQRDRMIILFKGLCREAGLIPGGAPEMLTRPRVTTPKSGKPSSSANGVKKTSPEPKDAPLHPETDDVSDQQASHSETVTPITSTPEYTIMKGVLSRLPFGKKWTQAERKKWLRAVAANVDMLFELEDPDTGLEMEEDIFRP
jgi:hypothetical protein